MKYAVVTTGGKQYRVTEGQVIEVERLETPVNEAITFENVLLVVDGDISDISVGKPAIDGVLVVGTVLEHTKGVKIRVAKFKAKARYRKVRGHRQSLTKVKIDQIVTGGKKTPTKEDAVIAKPKRQVAKKAKI